ncbi:hypothetical protein HP467_07000 [Curtobacterium albidum]|uniref:histidine kinase n=1 Tax=Curtobacterium citreum TaxID=2036 RepID=A0A850DUN6_9MICO|nr:histidine kinase [Curtobacterium albidum]NUU27860.1 hypothetical protein [Curtobacterium albidum]
MTPTERIPGTTSGGAGDPPLPTPPGAIRRFWQQHPTLTSVLLMLVWGGAELVGPVRAVTQRIDVAVNVVTAVLVVVSVAGIPFRRRTPLLTVTSSFVALPALTYSTTGFAPVLFGVYAATVYRSRRAGWGAAVAAVVLTFATTAVRVWVVRPGTGGFTDVVSPLVPALLLIAVMVGVNVRNRRQYTQALIARAEQLTRERDQQAQLAATAERARIAREMHDIVSHSLTVMVRLAEGAAAGLPDTGASTAAVRSVADVGRTAMTDMRRMLGVLNDTASAHPAEPAALAPQPAINDLPTLAAGFRKTGLPVRLSITGTPPADTAVQLVAHRIVQEGLTNVARHAPHARTVDVAVTSTAEAVTVTVSNSHSTVSRLGDTDAAVVLTGSGFGLIGVRERVHALGGTVTAAPTMAGGWELSASIPVRTEPA